MATQITSPTETEPLLGSRSPVPTKKPFYRPRPLWVVPFALVASVVRGMTLAPRVQVFTQLSCNLVHGGDVYDHAGPPQLSNTTIDFHATQAPSVYPYGPLALPYLYTVPLEASPELTLSWSTNKNEPKYNDKEPRSNPNATYPNCIQDPAVQATAARLQTVMAMTVGTLCALSTGWWGHFGERYGRTRVLATGTFGLVVMDLAFIVVSRPGYLSPTTGQFVLLAAPVIEGLLGGWSTIQAAVSAYVSDCTSDGSRAHIFSRLGGVFFLGLAIGPTLGAFIIRHPFFHRFPVSGFVPAVAGSNVTPVFYVAATLSIVNLLLALFVFPESLDKKKGEQAAAVAAVTVAVAGTPPQQLEVLRTGGGEPVVTRPAGHLERLLSSFSLFIPRKIVTPNGRVKWDWSLTVVASTLFVFLLSTGIFQIKYLYAGHTYGWEAEQLSYYISSMGAIRAVNLLVVMPFLISHLKSKLNPTSQPTSSTTTAAATINTKPKLSISDLCHEASFDLLLIRTSLVIDFFSHFLVFISPSSAGPLPFVAFTSMSSLGAGVVPAAHSLALCVLQMRKLAMEENEEEVGSGDGVDGGVSREGSGTVTVVKEDGGVGRLFAALSVLQALGQYIFGPMIFGLVYSTTVAHFPKAIFMTAASIIVLSLSLLFFFRPDKQYLPPSSFSSSSFESGSGGRRLLLPSLLRGRGSGLGGNTQGGGGGRGRSNVRKDLRSTSFDSRVASGGDQGGERGVSE